MSTGHSPEGGPPPGYPGGPPPGYPGGPPPGYPGGPQPENPTAKRLVNLSQLLGWGGIALLILVGPILGVVAESGTLAVVFCGLGLVSAIAGAIVGQIGRAMQGRVI
jgi:hypothetical protein